jgi:uroporphyrinogen-III decarboxylase
MRTGDKRRFLDAVAHKQSEEIPFVELEIDNYIAGKILEKKIPPHLLPFELPIPDCVELAKRMGNDMIYFSRMWRLGRKERKDDYGRIHYIDGMMKTPESLSQIWYPDMDEIERRLEELFNTISRTRLGVICPVVSAPFVVATAMGYQDYWLNTLSNPGFIHEFTKRIQAYADKELELYLRYPIDAFQIGSSFVTSRGPMCSPEMLEEFDYAYVRRHAQIVKSHNRLLWAHLDGKISDIMPDFIEMGVDIFQPLEPCGGEQNIYEIKRRFGHKITLCGNIDVDGVLLSGTVEEIKKDVLDHIEGLADGGGYIVASSHDIHQLIPLENFFAMRDAVHEYRFK